MVNTCTSTTFAFEPYIIRSFYKSAPAKYSGNRFGPLASSEPLDDYHYIHTAIMSASTGPAAPAPDLAERRRDRGAARRMFRPYGKKGPSRWHAKQLDRPSEAMDLAHSDLPLPWDREARRGRAGDGAAVDETPENYEPHLDVMLPGDITLDSIPRPSPPFVVRAKPRAAKRDKNAAMDDWDMVSNASDESFCLV